jgi:CheY-like chemotaxis protein
MQYTYFPVTLDQFGATVRYHDLVEGVFDIDDLRVTTHYMNHPALTLGYRLEADGATIVYCSDHEPHSRGLAEGKGEIAGQDLRYAEFIRGADLLIHDAQYTAEEYSTKIGWGHSSVEYAIRLGQHAMAKKLVLTHHDPLRDDDAIDRILARFRNELQATKSPMQVFAAVEGEVIQVEPSRSNFSGYFVEQFSATTSVEPALAERSVLLGISDPSTAVVLSEAIRAEGIRPQFFSTIDEARTLVEKDRPSLVILEHDEARIGGMAACREIRQMAGHELPVVMITAQQDAQAGAVAGVTDWLTLPFSDSYARTKIRAWVLRTECRWIRAAIPDDEERRIAALRELRILDTEPEERFDRVTRVAAALFGVPMVLISLVDENRQWFKSCLGLDSKETPRDAAFCAHVIHSREPIIVPDTFRDQRFADNPLVINEPRIRFYAGYPLILDDGSCIGTLCLLDTRPRDLKSLDLGRLEDLAQIALREIIGS